MQVPPDHNRHMAMLKAALPYAMPESRRAIEIMLQADAKAMNGIVWRLPDSH